MVEIMCGLPVVEDLVAVLYWREYGGDCVRNEEDVEGKDGLQARRFRLLRDSGPEYYQLQDLAQDWVDVMLTLVACPPWRLEAS